jgi:hypothetical protein
MMHERAITAAIAKSAITRVALLDDAFDPPALPDEGMGPLFEIVQALVAGEIAPSVAVTQEELDACAAALGESEYADPAVQFLVAKLFDAFVRTSDQKFDPGGHFSAAKANNLAYVLPLLTLLRKCNPALEVMPLGSHASDLDEAAKTAQLIFVDYYLNANLSPDGDPSAQQEAKARESSIARLTELLGDVAPADGPSIVLMSSHKVADRLEAFRQLLSAERGEAFASRFAFIEKRHLQVQAGVIDVEAEAFDALLEVVRSHAFGRALHTALSQWKAGAEAAVDAVWKDINALTLKDFSYLVRFRLAQEGMRLSEYVEWFFNECLADSVGQTVDWEAAAFKLIDQPDGPVADIRGAYDGPTKAVANMFDKVRIEKPRPTPRRNHRMGDLYLVSRRDGGREVRALLTPDCDLIRRKSGACKARALLFVVGTLKAIDAPDASLSDFVMLDGVAYNVMWHPKDIHTVPISHFPSPAKPPSRFKAIGTLKPLYAYELRARVLDDLSRFGLNVPPAMGSNARVTAIVEGETEDFTFELAPEGKAACSLVFSRGQLDETKAVFFESALAKLIGELAKIVPETVAAGPMRRALLASRKSATQDLIMTKFSAEGGVVNGATVAGIQITSRPIPRTTKGRPWCHLHISNEAIGGAL